MPDLARAIVDLEVAGSFIPPLPEPLRTLATRIERRAPLAGVAPQPFIARVTQLAALLAWRHHAAQFVTRCADEFQLPARSLALAVADLSAARNGWTPAPAAPLNIRPTRTHTFPSARNIVKYLSAAAPCVRRTATDWRPPTSIAPYPATPEDWISLADRLVDPRKKSVSHYRWISNVTRFIYDTINNSYWDGIATWAEREHNNETPPLNDAEFTHRLDTLRRKHPFVYQQVPIELLPIEPVPSLSLAVPPAAASWWLSTGGSLQTARFRTRAHGWVGLASYKLGQNPYLPEHIRVTQRYFGAQWPILLFYYGGVDEGRIVRNLARAIVDRVDSLPAQTAIAEWARSNPDLDLTNAAKIVLGLPYLIGCDLAPVSYRSYFPDPTFVGRKGGIVHRFTYNRPNVTRYWAWFVSLILSNDSIWCKSLPERDWFDFGAWWRRWASIRVGGTDRAAEILNACNRRRFASQNNETIAATEPPNPHAIEELVYLIQSTAARYKPDVTFEPDLPNDILPPFDNQWYWNARQWDTPLFIDDTWRTARKPPGRPRKQTS